MGDSGNGGSRFERDGSTLRFGTAASRVTVSVCTPRIARVELGGHQCDGAVIRGTA